MTVGAGQAQADIQAVRCGTALQDFGSGSGSTSLSPAMGTVTAAVNERWLAQSPRQARAGWWTNTGGDHTNPGTGYFVLMDIRTNRQGHAVYTNTLTGLEVGQSYTVSLWLASADPRLLPQVTVELPGTGQALDVDTATPLTGPDALAWQEARLTFTATAPTQALQVLERRAFTGGAGNDLALDDISLTHSCIAPPPVSVSTWGPVGRLMTTGGIVGLGWVLARRRAGRPRALKG
ncbi:hypothetical protein ACFSF0_08295 [Ottowia flava]|uniref:MAM domain-containing protein n=1 Tax=Ottowia flava TaxID=2675430 RepID=A0ABW4KRX4_9BURK|nr:hypothetical protein [Ottowia sp. GY511]